MSTLHWLLRLLFTRQTTLQIDLDRLSFLEAQIEFGLRLIGCVTGYECGFLFDLLRLLQVLEVILQGNVEIERIRPIVEAHAQEGLLTVVVLHANDEVARGVLDVLHGHRRVTFDRTRGEVRTRIAIFQAYQALLCLGDDFQTADVIGRVQLPVRCSVLSRGRLSRGYDVDVHFRFNQTDGFVRFVCAGSRRGHA